MTERNWVSLREQQNWTVQQKLLTSRKQEVPVRNQKENNIECEAALTGELQVGKKFAWSREV